MLDNIVHLVYNTRMNDFEKQLKEALKKNLRVEVETDAGDDDCFGSWVESTVRVYFGDDLIFSSIKEENARI